MSIESELRGPGFPFTEENLQALFWVGDQIPGGFFVYCADEDLELLYANQATVRMFGCADLDEFVDLTGSTFRGMVHPEDFERIQNSIVQQIAREDNENLDRVMYRIIRRDGQVRWVDDYGHFVHIEGFGDVFYVFISDITPRRRIQEERRRMERTLLEQKHKDEVKSAFLFNISHDLRTPISAILGFSELARRHVDQPELLLDYLDKTVTAGRQLLLIIDDMLEVNRLSSGHFSLKREPVQLLGQMELLLDRYRREAQERQITLQEELDLDGSSVLADQTCVRRLLSNLLGNAMKYTPQGGTVRFSARQRREGRQIHYSFVVADTGIGMSEEFMARMFDAFEREENSTQTGLLGTALGLTIVKRLVDQMEGHISVQSEKGKGSQFTVTLSLPLVCSGRDCEDFDLISDEPANSFRLLVAEDVEFNRTLAETLLEESGFQVECAVNGKEAVEAVDGHQEGYYDLILMDIQMPVMNGYDAARAIRALGAKGRLPIVALSANAREEDRRMSRESGMDDHVSKPFEIEELVPLINEHINASHSNFA